MAKKYLSIEEAAALLNVNSTELNRLREKGMIRAFADRGTWKFKEEDVEKLVRSRETDSSPDVPLLQSPSDDSSSEMVIDDEDVLADQPTIIRKSPGDDSSDSDVRLIFDDDMNVAGTAVPPLQDDSSDSDVKLAPGPRASADDSDSDVKLAATPGTSPDDSDSDVKLAGSKEGRFEMGSDSDVKLVMDDLPVKDTSGSDSDVRLVSSDSSGEVGLVGSGDVIPIAASDDSSIGEVPDDGSVIEDDSGISLGDGSGLALASDSGISLEQPNDSGISLSEGSSLVLGADSGISLAGDVPLKGDSGISLAQPASDKVKKKPVKGKMQPDAEDLSGTVPLMDVPLSEDEDLLDTHMEVPSLEDSHGSSDDLFSDEGETANVVTLDDEDEEGYDVTAHIPTQGGAAFDDDEEEIVATDDDEPVEVADDLVGEDDELAEDVFGAEDDDFADEVESGESHSELAIAPRGMVAAAEQDWGVATHTMLIVSTALTVACGTVLFDMVRNMWHTDTANHNPISSALLDMFRNI